MRRAIDAILMWLALLALLTSAWFLFWDIVLTLNFAEFKDPYHREPLEALRNSPLAPLLHLAILVGSIRMYTRFRRRTIEWRSTP